MNPKFNQFLQKPNLKKNNFTNMASDYESPFL